MAITADLSASPRANPIKVPEEHRQNQDYHAPLAKSDPRDLRNDLSSTKRKPLTTRERLCRVSRRLLSAPPSVVLTLLRMARGTRTLPLALTKLGSREAATLPERLVGRDRACK